MRGGLVWSFIITGDGLKSQSISVWASRESGIGSTCIVGCFVSTTIGLSSFGPSPSCSINCLRLWKLTSSSWSCLLLAIDSPAWRIEVLNQLEVCLAYRQEGQVDSPSFSFCIISSWKQRRFSYLVGRWSVSLIPRRYTIDYSNDIWCDFDFWRFWHFALPSYQRIFYWPSFCRQ